MGLQFRIGLHLREKASEGGVNLGIYGIAVLLVHSGAAAEGRHGRHHVLVQFDGTFDDAHHILQDLHPLFKEVVDIRRLGLDALFKLLEVVACRNFHENEDYARQYTACTPYDSHQGAVLQGGAEEEYIEQHQDGDGHPKCNFKQCGAKADGHRQLSVNHMYVTAVVVHGTRGFV